jgi:hypothetical protein
LNWAEEAEPFEQYVDVEGSDDLLKWHTLVSKAPLLNLSKEGQTLRHHRIELNSRHRYLRLKLADSRHTLPLTGVRADFVSHVVPPQTWQWRDLHGKRFEEQESVYFEFELDGRFPVERVNIASKSNDTRRWVLQSRDAPEDIWRTRAGPWLAYAVQVAEAEIRSNAQPLSRVCRDRYWRLTTDASVALPGNFPVPTLRLFYRPEALAFMLQGEAPYTLAVGSTKAVRMSSTLLQTIEALRQQKGEGWQPALAKVGQVEILTGDDALKRNMEPSQQPSFPWKAGLLWSILVAGAVLVLIFALRLLRAHRENEPPPA